MYRKIMISSKSKANAILRDFVKALVSLYYLYSQRAIAGISAGFSAMFIFDGSMQIIFGLGRLLLSLSEHNNLTENIIKHQHENA